MLLVGLGNWGDEYQYHRHNVGYLLVRRLADMRQAVWKQNNRMKVNMAVDTQGIRYLLAHSYMNVCGLPIKSVANYFNIASENICVVHDELDLPCGVIRLKQGGGHGGHNGLRDLIAHLGADFRRIRIGIDHPGHARQVINYVLSSPTKQQSELINDAIDKALACSNNWLSPQPARWSKAVQHLHTKLTD